MQPAARGTMTSAGPLFCTRDLDMWPVCVGIRWGMSQIWKGGEGGCDRRVSGHWTCHTPFCFVNFSWMGERTLMISSSFGRYSFVLALHRSPLTLPPSSVVRPAGDAHTVCAWVYYPPRSDPGSMWERRDRIGTVLHEPPPPPPPLDARGPPAPSHSHSNRWRMREERDGHPIKVQLTPPTFPGPLANEQGATNGGVRSHVLAGTAELLPGVSASTSWLAGDGWYDTPRPHAKTVAGRPAMDGWMQGQGRWTTT